jgi:two-component system, cell cycle sensor histidine kinase and response regulator CckA
MTDEDLNENFISNHPASAETSASSGQKQSAGYALADQNLITLACNAAFLDWVDDSWGQVIGKPLPALLPELVGLEDYLQQQLTSYRTDVLNIPKIYRASPGQQGRYFDLLIEPLLHFGPVLLVLTIDVTLQAYLELALRHERNELRLQIGERERAEIALRHAKDELEAIVAERTATLKQANEQLRLELEERVRAEALRMKLEAQLRQSQKMEAVGRLAGGIAHDFNNLLTVINGYSEMILQSLSEHHPLYRNIEQIKKAGDRAAGLTRRLLAFSRQQVLQPKVLNLNEIVGDLKEMLRRLIGEHIELVIGLDPHLKSIKADPGQLEQLLLNLAVNARDAMPDGGQLMITTSPLRGTPEAVQPGLQLQPGDYVKLTVSDTGTGMTDEVKAHLFEPFFTTKDPGQGTGMGLSICFGIVQQSAGYIDVESVIGQGTTFTVLFPVVDEPAANLFTPANPAKLLSGHETILVVEDEPDVRDLISSTLAEQGYVVKQADNGETGLHLAETQLAESNLQLVITDIVMPRLGGKELVQRLYVQYPDLKVLFISGYANNFEFQTIPGMAYLQKPFSPEVLLRQVRELLDD